MARDVLAGLKLGAVPYLNARPLIYGIEDRVALEIPSKLADDFAAGVYDAALIPVFELLREGGGTLADGLSISSQGEVFSVFLAHQRPVESLREVVGDAASRTSMNLLHCLLREEFKISPLFVPASQDAAAARLLIGDPAMSFRKSAGPEWKFYDLGLAWKRLTGLPFVYAAWAMRPGLEDAAAAGEFLRGVCRDGLAARSGIVTAEAEPEFALRYLTEFIRYDLGEEEKQALALFDEMLRRNGLLAPEESAPLRFV